MLDLLEEGRINGRKTETAGVKTTAACLGRLTLHGRKTKLFEMTLSLKSEKYRSAKKKGFELVLRYYLIMTILLLI